MQMVLYIFQNLFCGFSLSIQVSGFSVLYASTIPCIQVNFFLFLKINSPIIPYTIIAAVNSPSIINTF